MATNSAAAVASAFRFGTVLNKCPVMTTAAGTFVADNQDSETAGTRSPVLLHHYWLMKKMARFNRERVPDRVVYANRASVRYCIQRLLEVRGSLTEERIRKTRSQYQVMVSAVLFMRNGMDINAKRSEIIAAPFAIISGEKA